MNGREKNATVRTTSHALKAAIAGFIDTNESGNLGWESEFKVPGTCAVQRHVGFLHSFTFCAHLKSHGGFLAVRQLQETRKSLFIIWEDGETE